MPTQSQTCPSGRTRKERRAEKRAARKAKTTAELRLNAKSRRKIPERPLTEYVSGFELDALAMCHRDSLLDTSCGDVYALVDAYVDWLQGRPDKDDARCQRRAHWRSTNTGRALAAEHDRCEFGDLTCWTNRPGAEAAHVGCFGCVFSFPQPTAPDRSMLDVLGQLPTERGRGDRERLRARLTQLGGRYL